MQSPLFYQKTSYTLALLPKHAFPKQRFRNCKHTTNRREMISLLTYFHHKSSLFLDFFPQTLRLDNFDLTTITTEQLDQFIGQVHLVLEELVCRCDSPTPSVCSGFVWLLLQSSMIKSNQTPLSDPTHTHQMKFASSIFSINRVLSTK